MRRLETSLFGESYEVAQLALAADSARAVAQMAARFRGRDDRLAPLVREQQDALNRRWSTDRALVELLSESSSDSDQVPIQRLRGELETLDRTLVRLDASLSADFPEYRDLTLPEPISVKETQALLGPEEALLFYLVETHATHLWVVTASQAQSFRLDIDDDAMAVRVQRIRQQLDLLQARPANFDAGEFHDLYSAVLGPAAPLLDGIDHLFVVPDGALQSLPFSVLITEPPAGNSSTNLRELSWLVKRYASTVLPSPGTLRALRRFASSSAAVKPFVGFGDPLLDGGGNAPRSADFATLFARGPVADTAAVRQLARLPETADELYAMASELSAEPGDVFVGANATEEQVKSMDLSSFRVVAFSTHGLLAQEASELAGLAEPALVLTPPDVGSARDDGLLTASEIAQLRFNAQWVVLSACNTAAADGTSGAEGLSGLAKAFFYAGTRSLLVSHWSVESQATLALMKGLFEEYASARGLNQAQALRRAMLSVMNDRAQPAYAHPSFWGPFVVVGEGGSER